MNWIEITDAEDIANIKLQSFKKAQVIFKHSTRCSISSMSLTRLERSEPTPDTDFHFLDLIKFRSVSDLIAQEFSVEHASPQILLIADGKCVYDESHNGINMDDVSDAVNSFKKAAL